MNSDLVFVVTEPKLQVFTCDKFSLASAKIVKKLTAFTINFIIIYLSVSRTDYLQKHAKHFTIE